MRDDVTILVQEYMSLLEKKLSAIQAISTLAANAHFSLLSSDIESAQTFLEENKNNLNLVDNLDWEIAQIVQKIAHIVGVIDHESAITKVIDSDLTIKNDCLKIMSDISRYNSITKKAISSIIDILEEEEKNTVKTLSEISGLESVKKRLIFDGKESPG